jgi:chemotaxis methyl-accepting protein methylase
LFYQNTKTLPNRKFIYMENLKKENKLKTYYQSLSPKHAKKFAEAVTEILAISVTSFYRKLKAPQSLSPAEQQAIATAADVPVTDLF